MSYYTVVQCDKCGTLLHCSGIVPEKTMVQKILQYNWKIIGAQILCDECISEESGNFSVTYSAD